MKKTLRFLFLAIVLITPLAMPWESDAPMPQVMAVWAAAPSTDLCILTCYGIVVGGDCAEGEHVAWKEGDVDEWGGGDHTSCWPGTCQEKHPRCAPALLAVEDLKQAVRDRASRAGYTALAARHPEAIQIADGTLSMFDCAGELIAHLPLTLVVAE